MKTKINLSILLILASTAFFAGAKEIEQTKACRLATRFASGLTADSATLRSATLLQLAYTATMPGDNLMRAAAGRPLFYIYNVAGAGGFVIVSADDAVSPILGYAGQGEFTAQSMPSNLRKWLGQYEKEIAFAINRGYAAPEKIQQEWDALANGTLKAVNPEILLKTASWDQGTPYNNLCPVDGRSRSLAGCVATAMGTIMKYHQWPEKGTGSISYRTKSKDLPVNASFNVVYDWNNLLDTYARNNWSQAQGNAVATLLYHCGAAARMDYASDASGTTEFDAVDAFINNFGYDKGMYLAYRELYAAEEWDALLQSELKAKRPLLYGGITKEVEGEDQEGHQFIIDGYAPNGYAANWYYHVNWGWNGVANGYFLLNALDPQGGKAGEGFSYEQDASIGLQKAQEGSFANHEMFFIESDKYEVTGLQVETDSIGAGQPFLLGFSYIGDFGYRDFNGNWGIFIVDKQGNRKTALDAFDDPLEKGYVIYSDPPEEYTITGNVEEGDCIRMYYRPDGHDWKPVRGMPGAVLEIPLGVKFTPTSNVTVAPQKPSVTVSFQPGSNSIHIRSLESEAIREAWLYNLSGQLIRHDSFTSGDWQVTIPATQLSPGAYILKVRTTSGSYTQKVINNG
ncbi:hypothetical protein FACS189438_0130 [Bacteroidia bacterium]|nr:hypothetical protein FACS189438_0130 [Bacteroidia bacterium]